MKFLLALFFLLVCTFSLQAQKRVTTGGANNGVVVDRKTVPGKVKKMSVLFVGDLYSEYNSLPQIVAYQAAQLKKPVELNIAHLTAPKFSFEHQLTNPSIKETLKNKKWDYVVFQNLANKPLDNPEKTAKNGAALAKLVRDHGAKPLFFMTWADNGSPEDLKTIFNVYKSLALDNRALMAPVGTAWSTSMKNYPTIKLYLKDSSYPSPHGTYLSALMLTMALTKQSVMGQKNSGFKSVTLPEAKALQKVAYKTSLNYWKYIKKQAAAQKAAKKVPIK